MKRYEIFDHVDVELGYWPQETLILSWGGKGGVKRSYEVYKLDDLLKGTKAIPYYHVDDVPVAEGRQSCELRVATEKIEDATSVTVFLEWRWDEFRKCLPQDDVWTNKDAWEEGVVRLVFSKNGDLEKDGASWHKGKTLKSMESIGNADGVPVSIVPLGSKDQGESEKMIMKRVRLTQGKFRESLFEKWSAQCMVTEMKFREILIASHIKPWKDATNRERTDPNNGLVLSPLYDKLFDKHMISFDEDGKIMLGRDAEALKDAKLILGVERLKFNGSDGKIPEKMRSFMKLHNKEFKRMEAVRDAL